MFHGRTGQNNKHLFTLCHSNESLCYCHLILQSFSSTFNTRLSVSFWSCLYIYISILVSCSNERTVCPFIHLPTRGLVMVNCYYSPWLLVYTYIYLISIHIIIISSSSSYPFLWFCDFPFSFFLSFFCIIIFVLHCYFVLYSADILQKYNWNVDTFEGGHTFLSMSIMIFVGKLLSFYLFQKFNWFFFYKHLSLSVNFNFSIVKLCFCLTKYFIL